MAEQRDKKAAQHRRRELPARVASTPEVVAVEVDGGRLRTRAVGSGPGVHEYQNKEDKIACLVSLNSKVHEADPQPEPPESFLQPTRGADFRPPSGIPPCAPPRPGPALRRPPTDPLATF
jgi:hypothetical protein